MALAINYVNLWGPLWIRQALPCISIPCRGCVSVPCACYFDWLGNNEEKERRGRRAVHGRGRRRTFTMGDPRGGGQISGLSEATVVIIDVLGVEQCL